MLAVFTIGYEGRSLQSFLGDLRASGVKLVADAREAPISRKPGFSKGALAEALNGVGIAYQHFRPLGCPKPIRDRFRIDGNWELYTRDFMAHLRDQQSAIEKVAAAAQAQPTALLCYEADFNRCHRTYVARAVAALGGWSVRHITVEGEQPDATSII